MKKSKAIFCHNLLILNQVHRRQLWERGGRIPNILGVPIGKCAHWEITLGV